MYFSFIIKFNPKYSLIMKENEFYVGLKSQNIQLAQFGLFAETFVNFTSPQSTYK